MVKFFDANISTLSSSNLEPVCVLDSTSTVLESVRILLSHNYRSAPVRDPATNHYLGLFDFIDLLAFVVKFAEKHKTQSEIISHESEFFNTKLQHLANISGRNPLTPINHSATIRESMENLASGCKRIVIKEGDKISAIISQATVIQLLAKHVEELNSLETTVQENSVGLKPIETCSVTLPALEVFRKMTSNQLTSLPLVDEDSTIVTIISSRDLRLVFDEKSLLPLFLAAEDFVSAVRCSNPTITDPYPYIVVVPDATLKSVLLKLATTKVRRVFVVDERRHPIGVITLREMIQYVFKNLPK